MPKLSRHQLRQEIINLNRIDSKRASYDLLLSTYRRITEGLQIVVGLAGGGELFYRVRITEHKPQKISDFQAPPSQSVLGYQRCNPPGIPMFYAASRRIVALWETRVKKGQVVYLSQWIARDRIPVNRIFDSEENQEVNGQVSTLRGPNDDVLLAYFDTQFTRKIHADFADDYKFTAAAAQFLTTKFRAETERKIHIDGHVALKYPSVFDLEVGHNTAMHAEFAKERLELLHAMELRVLESEGNSIRVEVLDTATNFEDGQIHWTSDPSRIPALLVEERSVPFRHDGTKWNLQLWDGPVTSEYLEALLTD